MSKIEMLKKNFIYKLFFSAKISIFDENFCPVLNFLKNIKAFKMLRKKNKFGLLAAQSDINYHLQKRGPICSAPFKDGLVKLRVKLRFFIKFPIFLVAIIASARPQLDI